MAMNRKLQGEVERLLKKVAEGTLEFDGLLSKVYSATNSNQKEKYEADLKKEIKKLQRSRDQIKTWIASSEVKQKDALVEARKIIETKMESFKACERDSKTKAFSKEGLSMPTNDDDGKQETRDWIQKSLKELRRQIDQFETEIETVPLKKRPGHTRVEHLQASIVKHKGHMNKLEKVLRNLENDTITSEQDPDFLDDEGIYDTLGLKDDDPADRLALRSSTTSSGHDEDGSDEEVDSNSQGSSGSANSNASSSSSLPSNASKMPNPLATLATLGTTPPAVPAPVVQPPKKQTAPPEKKAQQPQQQQPQPQQQPAQRKATAPTAKQAAPPKPATQPVQYNQFVRNVPMQYNVVAAANTPAAQQSSQQHPPAQQTPQPQQPSAQPQTQPSQPQPAQPLQTMQTIPTPIHTTMPTMQTMPSQPQQPQQPLQSQPLQVQPSQPPLQTQPQTQHLQQPPLPQQQQHQPPIQPPAQRQPQPIEQLHLPQQPLPQQAQLQSPQAQLQSQLPSQAPPIIPAAHQHQPQPIAGPMPQQAPIHPPIHSEYSKYHDMEDDSKNNETFDTDNRIEAGSLADLASTTQQKLLGQAHGSANGEADQTLSIAMLETSMRNIPEALDSERPKLYVPKTPANVPPYYPTLPSPVFENPALFDKFDTDTLFYIFYYQQGTYQQYLAAKELKKQSWRYHKKYLTWFQRHEEPKEITNDYEQGTYVYFDYETGWCQRKKTEFTFEYRFLEDYD